MENLQKLTKASLTGQIGLAEKLTSEKPPINAPSQTTLRQTWKRLVTIYGNKFTSVNGILPEDSSGCLTLAGDTWSRCLTGITEAQIADGLAACLLRFTSEEWPPDPPKFRALCLGIPSLAAFALDLRLPTAEKKPFTRLAWSFIDSYRFRLADPAELHRITKNAYELAAEAVMRGDSLPACSGIIEAPKEPPRVKAKKEFVEKYITSLKSFFGGINDSGNSVANGA